MAKEKEELKLQKTKVEEKKKTSTKKTVAKTTTKSSKTTSINAKSAKTDKNKDGKEKKVSVAAKKNKATKSETKKVDNKKQIEDVKKEKELKEVKKVEKIKTSPKKTTSKNASKSKDLAKENKETKKIASDNKKSGDKKTTSANKKTSSSKKTNSSKDIKESIKIEKATPIIVEKEKVKEETIIEKIKSFIAKIVAMQEEAKKEELDKKGQKQKEKSAKNRNELGVLESTEYMPEYYDLPYRYNETVVKILAQTPKRIFVYWDIADEDKIRYEKAFGNDFFQKTYPVLLVHNDDKGYTMEIPINDFANSWYIDINDSKTKYSIQLGRKFKQIPTNIDKVKIEEQNIILRTDYLPIAQSNILEVPNDRILFNKMPRKITYRNVKTYKETEKLIEEIKTPIGILYNVKEFYQNNYKNEINDEEILGLNNPSSGGLSSSSFR